MVATEAPEKPFDAKGTLKPAPENESTDIIEQEETAGKAEADIVEDNDESGESDKSSEDEGPEPEWKTPVSKLPVPLKTLMTLAKAQNNLQPYTREITVQYIVERTLVKKAGLNDEGCKYILKRLITGVSTSVGFARPNYATMLMRITKAHAKNSGPEAVDTIIGAVSAVYGEGGTFNANYVSGHLEKTLGMLASTSAVVRGARYSAISVDAARKIIRILRLCVSGAAHKWDLTPAVVDVLQELLENMRKRDKIGDLMKLLWNWAEERSKMHDGVTMALLLFMEYEVISVEAFQKLYPQLSDISEPLLAMFDTGFPAVYGAPPKDGEDQEEEAVMQVDEVAEICVDVRGLPTAWALILRYFSTAPAKAHFGGISTFWKDLVIPKLVYRVKSIEKRLLMPMMLPSALACLTEDEPYEYVLNRDTYTGVVNTVFRMGKSTGPIHSKARHAVLVERFDAVKEKLFEDLYSVCTCSKLSASHRASLAEYIIRWVVERHHHQPLILGKLACVPEALGEETVPDFFASIAYFFLQPPDVANARTLREGYIKILERCTAVCPRLLGPFLHIVIMSASSHRLPGTKPGVRGRLEKTGPYPPMPKAPESFRSQMATLEADLSSQYFSKALPTAEPQLDNMTGVYCFMRLLDSLLVGQKSGTVVKRLELAERLLDAMVERTASKTNMEFPASNEKWSLREPVRKLNSSLQVLVSKKRSAPRIKSCLVTVARYLKIACFQPKSPIHYNNYKHLEKVSDLVSKCVSSLVEEDGGDGAASALEQTAHLLCVMCDGDANMGVVAKIGVELLAESIDDSVTAVLFDMLDAAKNDLSKAEDPANAMSESDDESVMEMSVDGDGPASLPEDGDTVGESKNEETQEVEKTGKSGKVEDAGNEESDILDVDVDPDTEDPSVLAAFDKHLGQHMKLVTEKKAAAKMAKQGTEDRINKLLAVIGIAANRLRLKVESKKHKCDQKTVAVFFDIFVRLQEFVLSNEHDASACAKRVALLCEKYMSKKQLFVAELTDVDLMADFAQRLFTCVVKYRGGRQQITALPTVIARTATTILEMYAKHHTNGYKDLVDYYNQLWTLYLQGRSRHVSNTLFKSFGEVAPAEMVLLALRAQEIFVSKEKAIRERRRAMEGLHLLAARAATLHSDEPLVAKPYWDRINEMGECLSDKEAEELWKDEVILKEFLGILRTGERVGVITKFYSQTIFQLAHSNKMYGKLRRDIRGMKRGLDATSEGNAGDLGSAQKKGKKAKH